MPPGRAASAGLRRMGVRLGARAPGRRLWHRAGLPHAALRAPGVSVGSSDRRGRPAMTASAAKWGNYPLPEQLPAPVIGDPALPLVSIVTPSYNQGRFIRETINSVLSQDYPNVEYWVIDGGSTDETITILREYEHDARFHWISEPDRGQSDAINKGWRRSRGEILAWLNSDDTYLPGAIRAHVQALRQHQDC